MRIVGIASTAILSLFLGAAAPAYAQHEQQGEKQDHPRQQQTKHEQAKPEKQHAQKQRQPDQKQRQPQHAQRQGQSDQKQRQPQHAQQQQRPERNKLEHAQQRRGNEQPHRTQEQQRIQHSAWQRHGSQHWDTDHRSWQQRGGYHGYRIPDDHFRIPDDHFRGYFGPDHGFRIYGLPFLVVGGYPRFQYQGYWLTLVDPWPQYWGNDWYDNDDVYVTYVDNGYYLFNRRYPSTGIAISISR